MISLSQEYLFDAFCILACTLLIANEFSPNTRLNYSKFTNEKSSGITIPSKHGMLLIYGPSLILSAFMVYLDLSANKRILWISITSFIHYSKRVYEVLNVHKYSGVSKLIDNIKISICYMSYVFLVHLFSSQVYQVSYGKFYFGFILYFIGEYINFYHHCILSRLREDGSKTYKIPSEGLFKYVWCPHYTGEIITFIAVALMSQHRIIFIMQLGSTGYLSVRSYNTRIWYQSKFETIPNRACLLPGIF